MVAKEVLKVKNLQQLKPFCNDDNIVEIVMRDIDKKFRVFQKVTLDDLVNDFERQQEVSVALKQLNKKLDVNVKNLEMLSNIKQMDEMSLLLSGANLCATCVGFLVVCRKLDRLEDSINNVLSCIKEINDLHLDTEFEKCRLDHASMLDHRKTKDYFSLDKMEELVAREYNVLNMLVKHFMKEVVVDKETLLTFIVAVAAMLSSSIIYYDEMYYNEYKDKISNGELWHSSHDEWINIFDKLASKEFMDIIQDHAYFKWGLNLTNVDLCCTNIKDSMLNYKQDILNNQRLISEFAEIETLDKYHKKLDETFKDLIKELISEDELASVESKAIIETKLERAFVR